MPTTRKTSPGSPNWITVIDGWVRDPAIRAFALTILAMVLIGLAVTVGLASGAIAAVINAVLPNVIAKVIGGSVGAAAAGSGIWLIRRRARIRRARTEAPNPEQSTTSS